MWNANFVRTVDLINQLNSWNKKPNLENEMCNFLEIFHTSINRDPINFAEAGLFLQESTVFYGKQVDLLYKGIIECHKELCNVYNDIQQPPEENSIITVQNSINTASVLDSIDVVPNNVNIAPNTINPDPLITLPEEELIVNRNKRQKNENNVEEIVVEVEIHNESTVNDNSQCSLIDLQDNNQIENEKFSIPGVPDELLEKLNLSDCLPGGPLDEIIDKLDTNHPLSSIFSKLGKEMSQNKDVFTYNNLSLSGMSWNALYQIEEVLNRRSKLTEHENEINKDNSNCLGINENSSQDMCYDSAIDIGTSLEETEKCTNATATQTPAELFDELQIQNSEISRINHTENTTNDANNSEQIKDENPPKFLMKELRINLLKLSYKLLTKKFHFNLPVEYFAERKSERLKEKQLAGIYHTSTTTLKRKRDDTADNDKLMKKVKSFNLDSFEEFCYNYYESQGLVIPRPDKIIESRKSLDNHSELSYGNPLTPAESGRFSLSFVTDSEFDHDHCDNEIDNCGHPYSRADSGIEMSGSFSPMFDDVSHNDAELNPTLKTLKALFPTTFSDPKRAEVLKDLYKQPEDDENYVQWKKFIDDKTGNEEEFNIHEYGTNILNSFTASDQIGFDSVVKDKSVGEVSRYFVSALQLVNTYNIEIFEKYPGEIRSDSMQLKFLCNERQHEEIDAQFNELSEDTFMDNLLTRRSNKIYQSTPIQPVAGPSHCTKPVKRRRLDY